MSESSSVSPVPKRVRTRHFQNAKESGTSITGLTSYDQLTAHIFDEVSIDFLLVGDSVNNTVFGYDTTLPVTVDELIPSPGPLPWRRSERSWWRTCHSGHTSGPLEALHTAVRFMKETHAHAVKLEGGVRSAEQIRRIVEA